MDARSLVLLGSILTASPSLITVDPTFTDAGAGLGDVVEGATAWGDYDNDGDLDVVLTGLVGSPPLTRLYRNPAGNLADVAAGLAGVDDGGAAWGDYDNDGDLDLVLA